jgi:hypothetical protein
MKSCVGEEGSESRIKLQRSDICYRELEQKASKGTCKGTPQASMLGSKSLEEPGATRYWIFYCSICLVQEGS